ncbi:hypothetical protein DACRYDRAFT_111414 [Dacryopinax primogenitus]|uniref:Uncharacterized protein n=1 Tax=Dacryopinax primogenitus (strain DJM 731) TaxID=1858805 RepID=M5FS12_DACPD|nr:uncharacterized protein DACRYDRAFT_111414 [Dacryopinax primogenitus]EJT97894.1 hypothetical protein DACRYDRAFT_111414 [Dacryopinax primogenitus]
MGLKDQKELFNNMKQHVQEACIQHNLDVMRNITEHPPALLLMIYKQVKEKSPQLAAFNKDWATQAMIQQFAKNRKYNTCKKEAGIAAERANLVCALEEQDEDKEQAENTKDFAL